MGVHNRDVGVSRSVRGETRRRVDERSKGAAEGRLIHGTESDFENRTTLKTRYLLD